MNKLVTAVALATLIASPAFAQSFDPHLGSGNIVRPIPGATGALARRHAPPEPSGPLLRRGRRQGCWRRRARYSSGPSGTLISIDVVVLDATC